MWGVEWWTPTMALHSAAYAAFHIATECTQLLLLRSRPMEYLFTEGTNFRFFLKIYYFVVSSSSSSSSSSTSSSSSGSSSSSSSSSSGYCSSSSTSSSSSRSSRSRRKSSETINFKFIRFENPTSDQNIKLVACGELGDSCKRAIKDYLASKDFQAALSGVVQPSNASGSEASDSGTPQASRAKRVRKEPALFKFPSPVKKVKVSQTAAKGTPSVETPARKETKTSAIAKKKPVQKSTLKSHRARKLVLDHGEESSTSTEDEEDEDFEDEGDEGDEGDEEDDGPGSTGGMSLGPRPSRNVAPTAQEAKQKQKSKASAHVPPRAPPAHHPRLDRNTRQRCAQGGAFVPGPPPASEPTPPPVNTPGQVPAPAAPTVPIPGGFNMEVHYYITQ